MNAKSSIVNYSYTVYIVHLKIILNMIKAFYFLHILLLAVTGE